MSIIKKLRERAEPLNVAELAALMAVTAATVQRWVRNRQIPFIRIGGVLRFDGCLLGDWIELEGACDQHPRADGSTDDFQIKWTDLGELAPKEVVPSPRKKP